MFITLFIVADSYAQCSKKDTKTDEQQKLEMSFYHVTYPLRSRYKYLVQRLYSTMIPKMENNK